MVKKTIKTDTLRDGQIKAMSGALWKVDNKIGIEENKKEGWMNKGLIKVAAVVLAGVMLLTVPGLVGCGDDNGGVKAKPEIIVGFLGDLTGPGSFAVAQTHDGTKDYLTRYVPDANLIPEVDIKWIGYDSRGDRGRVQPGYKWLKGQGADLITTISGDEAAIIEDSLAVDGIPDMSSQSSMSIFGSDWAYGQLPPPGSQGQAIMHWVGADWNGTGPMKIGLMGLGPLIISREILEYVLPIVNADPAKYEWKGEYMVPYGTMNWASEVEHLKDCDYIIVTAIGASMASFMKEAKDRGFQGRFVGCMESLLAFWELVRDVVPPEQLDGATCSNPYLMWDENLPWINTMKEQMEKWYTAEEIIHMQMVVGYIGGWSNGTIMSAAIKQAVDTVGAENVDGTALRDALETIKIDLQGAGNIWEVGGGINSYCQTLRMWQYSASTDKWGAISDWYRPPLLGG